MPAAKAARNDDDERGRSNMIEKAAAIKLVLASRDLTANASRQLNMIDWILEGEDPKPGNNDHRSVRLFVDAIKATKV